MAPSVATVSTERSTLEVRPVMKEVLALVGDLQTETDETTTRLTGSRKAPEQPKFHGKNFPLFLSRYRRWSLLSGIDRADDDTKRVWFISAMAEEVLELAEAVYNSTATFKDLVVKTSETFPSYVTDFSLRHEAAKVKQLPNKATREQLEHCILELETYWSRMSEGAVGDQEKLVALSGKLAASTWQAMREHARWRDYITSYDKFKDGLRGFIAEQRSNDELSKLRSDGLLAITSADPKNDKSEMFAVDLKPPSSFTPGKYRGKEDKSNGAGFRGTVSCHYCGRLGHYRADCWRLHPEKKPAGKGKGGGKGGKGGGKGGGGTQERGPPPKPGSTGPEDAARRAFKRPRDDNPGINIIEDFGVDPAPVSSEAKLLNVTASKNDLLYCTGKMWDKEVCFVVDTGAALEGVVSVDILPENVNIQRENARMVKVGDGRAIWTEGTVEAAVQFGPTVLNVTFAVLRTTAFDALLGIKFLRRPEVKSLQFHPPSLHIGNEKICLVAK